jgi:predicted Zn-dependent peptidase
MSSRLFMEVREKRGLAYSVHAGSEQYTDTGYFVVQAGVEHAKLEKAVETILNEFKKIKKTKVSKTELDKAKNYIKGTMTLSLETSDRIAQRAATSLLEVGRVRSMEEVLEGIDKVSIEDIQRVSKDLLKSDKLNLAIIGPHDIATNLKKLLRI